MTDHLETEVRQALDQDLDTLVDDLLSSFPETTGVLFSPAMAREKAWQRVQELIGVKVDRLREVLTGDRTTDAMAIAGLIASQVDTAKLPITLGLLAVLTLRLLLRREK